MKHAGQHLDCSPADSRVAALRSRVRRRSIAASVAAAFLLAPPFVSSMQLGDVELRSGLGEPVRASIPYRLGAGEWTDGSCVHLLPDEAMPVDLRHRLRSQRGGDFILLESTRPLNDPYLRFAIEMRCGSSGHVKRDYVVLPDLPGTLARRSPRTDLIPGDAASGEASPARLSARREAAVVRAKTRAEAPARTEQVAPTRRAEEAERTLPRLSLAHVVSADTAAATVPCCMRLSYELADRAPISEVERERLRQSMLDPEVRVQSLSLKTEALQRELESARLALENANARRPQPAQAAPGQAAPTHAGSAFQPNGAGVWAVLLLLLGSGALWLVRRRHHRESPSPSAIPVLTSVQPQPAPDESKPQPAFRRNPEPLQSGEESKPQPAPRRNPEPPQFDRTVPVITLPGHIAASLDPALRAAEYRKAYLAGRFPEIEAGSITLDDSVSVVEGARIFYQDDHNPAKALELLRIALAAHPEHVRLWLALFEILSMECLAPEFADLAQRYHDSRNVSRDTNWPMIAKLGRDLDPQNPLFRADGLPPVEEEHHNNWLNSQLDMMGETLALELRTHVLQR